MLIVTFPHIFATNRNTIINNPSNFFLTMKPNFEEILNHIRELESKLCLVNYHLREAKSMILKMNGVKI